MTNVLYAPVFQILDDTGEPIVGASMYFYLTGTTTPEAVYEDFANTTPIAQPLVSDITGTFPTCFFNPNVTYRMKLVLPGGSLGSPYKDIDPVAVEQTGITDLDVIDALGYTPVNPAAAIFTAPARLVYSPTPTARTSDEVGFAGSQVKVTDANYTLTINDSQALLVKDDTSTPSWEVGDHTTLPWPIGHEWEAANVNTGNVTINFVGSAEIFKPGGTSYGTSVQLGEGGYAKFCMFETDKWIAKGANNISVS